MGAVGIFLIVVGYTLIYSGIKGISPVDEFSYGLGLGENPTYIRFNRAEKQKTGKVEIRKDPETGKEVLDLSQVEGRVTRR